MAAARRAGGGANETLKPTCGGWSASCMHQASARGEGRASGRATIRAA
jgi:hypothetical protein